MYKPIPGFPNYQISDTGVIINGSGKELKQQTIHDHKRITLYKNGVPHRVFVHRLVLWAYLGPQPEGTVVNHINGQKDDNRLDNLEYVTPSENTLHAREVLEREAIYQPGELNPRSKLVPRDVIAIRAQYGVKTSTELAKQYRVTPRNIRLIVSRTTWKHLP